MPQVTLTNDMVIWVDEYSIRGGFIHTQCKKYGDCGTYFERFVIPEDKVLYIKE